MILSNEDAKYFYDLWIPLLDYVNRESKLLPELYGMTSPSGLPLQKVAIITNKLWENTSVIDDYIASTSLNHTEIKQLEMWKNHSIHDRFIVDRHLQTGSVFISVQTESVYLVKGIYSSLREMLQGLPMPHIVTATLLPFKNVIIHDGIIMPHGITLGKNVSDHSKEIYRNAKATNSIISCFS